MADINTDNTGTTEEAVKFFNRIPEYVKFNYGTDYSNIRNRFQKGYTSVSGEPGFFYFRVFFDMKSPLLFWSDTSENYRDITAQRFLDNNRGRCGCDKRLKALQKFRKLLYYIIKDTPWAIRAVSGTGTDMYTDLRSPAKDRKKIKLDFSEEFTDFRLTLLYDLYRYICFDYVNQKVIVPENLRKFNMSVMYFGIPLKYLHTPIPYTDAFDQLKKAGNEIAGAFGKKKDNKNDLGYMSLNKEETVERGKERIHFQDTVSVHMIHFMNCELSLQSTYNTFVQADNSNAFQTKPSLEINYDRSYTQDISEWFEAHISEMHDNYFDSTPDVPSGAPENTGWSFKKMLKSIGSAAANALLGSSELLSSAPGLNKRRKYWRETGLYGGSNALSKLNGMLENAVNTITGSLVDYISLGNIYDDSWLSNLKGAANAASGSEMIGGLIKSGLSAATNNVNSAALNSFINGGAGSFVSNLSSMVGSAATSPGNVKAMFNNWFRNADSSGSAIDIWPSGPNVVEPRHYPIIEMHPNIYTPLADFGNIIQNAGDKIRSLNNPIISSNSNIYDDFSGDNVTPDTNLSGEIPSNKPPYTNIFEDKQTTNGIN